MTGDRAILQRFDWMFRSLCRDVIRLEKHENLLKEVHNLES